MSKLVRLTESDLHRIVKESVKNILNEMGPCQAYHLGRAAARRERVGDIDYAMQMRKHYQDSVQPGLEKDYDISGYFDNTINSDNPFIAGYLDQKDFMGNIDRYKQNDFIGNRREADDAFEALTDDQRNIKYNSNSWRTKEPVKDKLKKRMRQQMNMYRFDNFKE